MRQFWALFSPLLLSGVGFPAQAGEPKALPKLEVEQKAPAQAVVPPDTTLDDQKLLRDVGLGIDGPALLEYFKKRTYPEANAKEMAVLIAQLGDEDFGIREKAYDRLLVLGAGALVGIKEAEKNPDAEVSRRADEIRHRIEAKAEPAIQSATARLLAVIKPVGAAEVLLNYLPFAADHEVADEICKCLGAIAAPGGKVEPAVVKALADKVASKRAAAGEALARARVTEQLPAVRKLLKDPDPAVRLQVALALVPLKEREVVPVLVDALGYFGPEQLWPVQEILDRLAGDKAPAVSLGTTEETRKICRKGWQTWLDTDGKTIDLAKLQEAPPLGYTLVVQQNVNRVVGNLRRGTSGEVIELDADKKTLWKFEVPTYPVDAQIVRVDGTERVLIAEYQAGRVSERDFKGEVKWEKNVGGNPIGVQRLANGNTFVVMQNRLVELERSGKEAFSLNRPSHDIFRARKLRNGEVVFVTNNGMFTRIEAKTQKVLKTFQVGQVPVLFGSIDVLPDGGVLIPDFQKSSVVEFNANGKEVNSFKVNWPNSVMRLPNGNTLVASQNTRRIAEYDRTGREVWSHVLDGMPFNARRR